MNIEIIDEAQKVTIKVSGRIDTVTAPTLEREIETLGDVQELVLDFENLEYTSSAGLRVILKAQKKMAALGGMKIVNAGADIKEIFDMTGFSDILNIE